jgi:hypothetical protein
VKIYYNLFETISVELKSPADFEAWIYVWLLVVRLIHSMRKQKPPDFECVGVDNAELADWINRELSYDQLIVEYYTPGEPNSGWIHCSWIAEQPRASFLWAYRSEGKTKYKPILGKAKDLV